MDLQAFKGFAFTRDPVTLKLWGPMKTLPSGVKVSTVVPVGKVKVEVFSKAEAVLAAKNAVQSVTIVIIFGELWVEREIQIVTRVLFLELL
jgi:hypothetical protein